MSTARHDMLIGVGAAVFVACVGLSLFRPRGLRADWSRQLRSPAAEHRWFRTVSKIGVLIAGLVLLGPVGIMATPMVYVTVTAWRRLRDTRKGVASIRRQVPDAVDLMVLGIRAGLTPAQAFAELGSMLPTPIGAYFAEVISLHHRGERFADALDALHAAPDNMLRPLATALARAERYGEPLAPVLDRLGAEARRERRRQADTSARQLPVRMCFPLACCTLPAFVLLTIVPLLAGTFSSIRGNLP